MVEIGLENIILFDAGFILNSSTTLQAGTGYNLTISDGTNTIIKTYTPARNGNVIIDIWGAQIPNDGTICLTLNDTGCTPLVCALEMN